MKRKQPQASDPIDLAAGALRHHDRSRHQIDERLARAGVEGGQRADALDALERIGYLDDARFAGQRAASLAGRGYGDDGIRALLTADGLAGELIDDAIAALPAEGVRAAEIVASLGTSPRTAARLQRKGFGGDAVEAAAGGFATDGSEA